ncbi:NlpC/P60 family protein [Streptomyces sp. NBC_01803]|uniref:NlpC/P60 family protein n=1 Tax=Streptomyces sp. NBC_01803 TaxID=2975946 RepID=UPI002DD924F2|nr:NlpC/P60 family protein [Streptomyces sp. NBC_01803]WSA47550.1 NlpC/P60 family protein [Streptomyces sp. NBC_01803]
MIKTLAGALTALALTALTAPPAGAEPRDPEALLTELRTLYRQTGAATEAFNETDERLRAQRAEVERLTERLADTRTDLAAARRLAGRLAAGQYRQGALTLPPALRLLLGEDPGQAMHDGTVAVRTAAAKTAEIDRLVANEERADELTTAAREALDTEETLAEERRSRRDEIHRRLDEVTALLAGLTPEETAELAARELAATDEAQRELLASGTLDDDDRPPSPAGQRALTWALAQLGKPYAWGAEGPAAFDCSGLTSQAWAHAGVTIPRTSQRQWNELPRVPLSELRPGDLVIYREDAGHVALYAGDAQVVHAPRPGTEVTLAPLASDPVRGAVRPG